MSLVIVLLSVLFSFRGDLGDALHSWPASINWQSRAILKEIYECGHSYCFSAAVT